MPPFTAFINPHDPLTWLSFAIPDEPVGGDLAEPLERLKDAFRTRERVPRFEYVESFAPELAAPLEAAGFTLELRAPAMICTPETLGTPPGPPELLIRDVAGAKDASASVRVGRVAFGLESEVPVEDEAERLLKSGGRALLGLVEGEPVAVVQFTAPLDGLTELVGIGTVPEHRGRGFASYLTAAAARLAFQVGVELAFLTPGDEGAVRVYERAGFATAETMLFYKEVSPTTPPPPCRARPHAA